MSQNLSTAVMQRRHEPHDSLDFFPTPPWATRALCVHVIGDHWQNYTAWDPACGEGDMAKPLTEYFKRVHASDIHDYSAHGKNWCQDRVVDFLWPGSEGPCIAAQGVDWIITNPPFRLADQFIRRGLELATVGVAVLVRTAFLEGCERYRELFNVILPSIVAQFAERVPMVKGRLDQEAASATAYCWIVWRRHGHKGGHTRMQWIPPCRKKLELATDYYDAAKDLGGSINVGLETIRSRVAAGGEGWSPK